MSKNQVYNEVPQSKLSSKVQSPMFLVVKREVRVSLRTTAWRLVTLLLGLGGAAVIAFYDKVGELMMWVAEQSSSTKVAELQAQASAEVFQQYGLNADQVQAQIAAKVGQGMAADSSLSMLTNASGASMGVGIAVCVVLFAVINVTGQQLCQQVVEEKSSKIVEILLASLTPNQLLFGKVLGSAIVNLACFFSVFGIWAVAFLVKNGGLPAASADGSGGDLAVVIVSSLIWFIVGYVTFSSLYAAFGATVERPEDAKNAAMPLMMFVMITYMVTILSTTTQIDGVSNVISFIPLVCIFAAPTMFAMGTLSLTGNLIMLGVSVLCIPLLLWAGARIYNYAILQTGQKVNFLKAFARVR